MSGEWRFAILNPGSSLPFMYILKDDYSGNYISDSVKLLGIALK